MATTDDWHYAAALLDGEGCFYISKINPKHNRKDASIRYTPYVQVQMNDREPIDFMVGTFGGSFQIYLEKRTGKNCYKWSIACKKLQGFIPQILPLLKIRRKRTSAKAVLALSFRMSGWKGYGKLPEKEVEARGKLYWKVREANSGGRAPL